MFLVRRALVGVARRNGNAVDAERGGGVEEGGDPPASASLKKVQLIVTRKPLALAAFNAATARS